MSAARVVQYAWLVVRSVPNFEPATVLVSTWWAVWAASGAVSSWAMWAVWGFLTLRLVQATSTPAALPDVAWLPMTTRERWAGRVLSRCAVAFVGLSAFAALLAFGLALLSTSLPPMSGSTWAVLASSAAVVPLLAWAERPGAMGRVMTAPMEPGGWGRWRWRVAVELALIAAFSALGVEMERPDLMTSQLWMLAFGSTLVLTPISRVTRPEDAALSDLAWLQHLPIDPREIVRASAEVCAALALTRAVALGVAHMALYGPLSEEAAAVIGLSASALFVLDIANRVRPRAWTPATYPALGAALLARPEFSLELATASVLVGLGVVLWDVYRLFSAYRPARA